MACVKTESINHHIDIYVTIKGIGSLCQHCSFLSLVKEVIRSIPLKEHLLWCIHQQEFHYGVYQSCDRVIEVFNLCTWTKLCFFLQWCE